MSKIKFKHPLPLFLNFSLIKCLQLQISFKQTYINTKFCCMSSENDANTDEQTSENARNMLKLADTIYAS